MRLAIIVTVLLLAAATSAAAHEKTDIVTIDDGSTYYGEILELKYAILSLKTSAAGTLDIEWRRITGVTSTYQYYVGLTGGARYYGTLEPPDNPGHLKVVSSAEVIEVELSDVVRIAPIEHTFWQRLKGSLNFGLTYTQANEVFQYNLGLNANYRSLRNYATFSASSIFNTQQDTESTQQHDLQLVLAQISEGRWGPFQLGAIQSNPAQGFDIRTLLGGGASRFFVESTTHLFALNLGAVYNREEVTDSDEVASNAELMAAVSFRRYKRASDSPGIDTSLKVFSDITSEEERYRADFKFNVAWKIVGDYNFNFTFNDSYDSNPPGADANKNNVVVVTSIGYTF